MAYGLLPRLYDPLLGDPETPLLPNAQEPTLGELVASGQTEPTLGELVEPTLGELVDQYTSPEPYFGGDGLDVRAPDISRTAPSTVFQPEFVRPYSQTAFGPGAQPAPSMDLANLTNPPTGAEDPYQRSAEQYPLRDVPVVGGVTNVLSRASNLTAPPVGFQSDPLQAALGGLSVAPGLAMIPSILKGAGPASTAARVGIEALGGQVLDTGGVASRAVRGALADEMGMERINPFAQASPSQIDELLPAFEGGATANPTGLRDVIPKPLSWNERAANNVRGMLHQPQTDELATPIMAERTRARNSIESLSAITGEESKAKAATFPTDKQGRITNLATPEFPNGPTIQDVAARLPQYEPYLNPQQQGALVWLRDTLGEFRAQWDEVQQAAGTLAERPAKELNTRGDIIEGGFYIPRGRAAEEGVDAPVKVISAGRGAGGAGFSKAAVFDSMAQGIDNGYEYAPFNEAVQSYVRDIGGKINDRAAANRLLELADANGIKYAQTAADRVDPTLRAQVQKTAASIAGKRVTAIRQRATANAMGRTLGPAERDVTRSASLVQAAESRLNSAIATGVVTTKPSQTIQNAVEGLADAVRKATNLQGEAAVKNDNLVVAAKSRVLDLILSGKSRNDPVLADAIGKLTGMAKVAAASEGRSARIAASVERFASRAETVLMERIVKGSTDTVISAAERELMILRREATRDFKRATVLGDKAGLQGAKFQNTIEELDRLQADLFDLRGHYRRAQDVAKNTPRAAGQIGMVELTGYDFPDALANAANMVLNSERPLAGKGAGTLNTVRALNNLYRGFKSTLDNSYLGIQALLGLGADQKAYGSALKVNAAAWRDEKALGKMIENYDRNAQREGMPLAADWVRANLHVGGTSTEFQIGASFSTRVQDKIGKVPVLGGAMKGADRAFGFTGDALRLEWAQNELRTNLKGRTWQELAQTGELDKIAQSMNRMTGWSPVKVGGNIGDIGDLVLFAPRFLQARLETLVHAVKPTNDLEARIARNALLRTVGGAVVLTVAANKVSGGHDGQGSTDFRPFMRDAAGRTKPNPNFMKVRFNNQDWGLLGPWDSLARIIIQIGAAADPTSKATFLERAMTPLDIMHNLGSGAQRDVANAIELFSKGTVGGKPASEFTALDYAGWIAGHFTPMSAPALGKAALPTAQAAFAGDVGGTVAGTVATFGQLVGGKASDISYSDVRDIVTREMFGGKPDGQGGVYPDGVGYEDVGRTEQKAVRGDQRLKDRAEQFPDTVVSDKQRLEVIFDELASSKSQLESGYVGEDGKVTMGLSQKIQAGLKGKDLRDAIKTFKQQSFGASNAIFNNPANKAALDRSSAGKTKMVKDQLRDQYWDADLPESVVNGEIELDRAAQQATREAVLVQARAAGVTEAYITTRDPERYTDPVVRATMLEWEAAQETLSPYWEAGTTVAKTQPSWIATAQQHKAAATREEKEAVERSLAYRYYERALKQERERLRANKQNGIDAALVKWYSDRYEPFKPAGGMPRMPLTPLMPLAPVR